jgi:CheY-like chemotaxis protein
MGARVLVAEDNDDYRTVLRMLLTAVGCSVVEASNGLEAIDRAVSTYPDLIIMDVLMPQLGGLEATKRLKADPRTRDIPIVLCTALGMEALGHRQLTNHPHEIIQKPVRLEKLREIVQKYVPQENQQQTALPARDKRGSVDDLEAWRLLNRITHAINEGSLTVGLPEPHIFDKWRKDGRPAHSDKGLETASRLALRTHGRKLFAGLVQLLHTGSGCLELLSIT